MEQSIVTLSGTLYKVDKNGDIIKDNSSLVKLVKFLRNILLSLFAMSLFLFSVSMVYGLVLKKRPPVVDQVFIKSYIQEIPKEYFEVNELIKKAH